MRPRIADSVAEIRARRDELARERDQLLSDPEKVEFSAEAVIETARVDGYAACRTAAGWWVPFPDKAIGPSPTVEEVIRAVKDQEAELVQEIFGNAGKAAAHGEALGPALACAVTSARDSGVEFSLGPRGLTGVVNGFGFGPFRSLSLALVTAFVLRDFGFPENR
jgi:hypothetical protein